MLRDLIRAEVRRAARTRAEWLDLGVARLLSEGVALSNMRLHMHPEGRTVITVRDQPVMEFVFKITNHGRPAMSNDGYTVTKNPDDTVRDNESLHISVYDNKYTVVQTKCGGVFALRHGEPWRDCVGDGLILALAHEIAALREQARKDAQRMSRMANGCKHASTIERVLLNPCVQKLHEGEPFFVLRGQDRHAATTVAHWLDLARPTLAEEKVFDTVRVIDEMARWPHQRDPD